MDLILTEQENSNSEALNGNYYTPYNVDMKKMIQDASLKRFVDKVSLVSKKILFLLTDFTTAEFIEEKLGVQFKLSENQKTEITRIIRDVLLTDMYLGDMPAEISKRMDIDPNTAREIANQIVSQFFTPVLDEIKKVQAVKFPNRVSQGQPRPIPGADLPETGGNIIDLRKMN